LSTGINDLKDKGTLHFYPNPASDMLHIAGGDNDAYPLKLSFFDTQGRLAYSYIVSSNSSEIDITGLPDGFYLSEMTSGGQLVGRAKLIIRR
jgi:hypothetical protein